ncbi:MAG: hypothetical protein AB8F74_01780 [Saprospiraceae bacterium]
MKNIIIIALIASALLMMPSCANEELGPVVTFEKATIGAYVRFVDQRGNAEFDLANVASSAFEYDVDFVSLDGGSRVAEYIVTAQFIDNTAFKGDDSKPRSVYKTVSSSAFTPSAKGNPGTTVVVSFQELLGVFGLSEDQITASDQFALFGAVRTDDGAEYTSNNSTATIRGSAFQGFFDIPVNVTCPLPSDVFVGDYTATFDGAAGGGYGVPFAEGTYTLSTVAGSSTQREFSVTYLPQIGGFGPYSFTIDFVCDKTDVIGMVSGVGCVSGSLTIGAVIDPDSGLKVSPAVDIADDSSFSIIMNEGTETTGCAAISETMTRVVFTKN